MTARRLAILGLVAVLIFDVWWRCHTISGTVKDALGFAPWPVVAEAEPLDCDEAILGYIGKRLVAGDVMYRDLTDTKPPLGYWLNGLAVLIGGANETTIRVMPIPMVLITIVLVWWIAGRLAGQVAAVVSAFLYALMSTDPYLYGNGADMEHAINLFGTASLALLVFAWPKRTRWPLFAAGACLGAAGLVKQVAIMPFLVSAIALSVRQTTESHPRTMGSRAGDLLALVSGAGLSVLTALGVLLVQGAGWAAYQDVILYGGALATETPRDPKEYSYFVRWLVGNTDPNGLLPWPFGSTHGRAWWAAGSWPLWAVSLPAMVWAGLANRGGPRRLVAGWTIAAWVAVALPGMFWQHYYLLPVPGVAIVVAIAMADATIAVRLGSRRFLCGSASVMIVAAILATTAIQIRDYLLVTPNKITERYKGGGQWVVLREIGRELGRRTRSWNAPHLYVWGIQSPLYFYSGLDGVTPQVFTDPFLVAFADRDHRLVRPRIVRTMNDLELKRPELIFVGERPFPALLSFLRREYVHEEIMVQGHVFRLPPNGPGLWLRRDRSRDYETAAETPISPTPPSEPR